MEGGRGGGREEEKEGEEKGEEEGEKEGERLLHPHLRAPVADLGGARGGHAEGLL